MELVDVVAVTGASRDKGFVIRDEPLVRGINNAFSARWITATHCVEMTDGDLEDPTRPIKRDGYAPIGIGTSGIAAGLLAKRPAGIAFLNPSTGDRMLVMPITSNGGGKVYYTLNPDSTNWAEAQVDGSSFDPQTDDVPMFQANDKLWIIGANGVLIHVLANTGALVSSGSENEDAPVNMVDGTYFQNRVWLLSPAGVIYWSNPLPQSPIGFFNRTMQSLTLSPNRGSRATALRPWRDQSLIAMFHDSIEEMIVDNNVGTSILNSQRLIIDREVGCSSRKSVVAVGDDFIFQDQFGQIRTLKRTAEANIAGTTEIPLSENIRGELPGRINKQALDRTSCHVINDRLEVSFARDKSMEANYRAVYDFSLQAWVGIHALAKPVGHVILSNIRDRGEEVFHTDGSETSATPTLFRDNAGTYTDNGATITYTEVTRALAFKAPEAEKVWMWCELEYVGDVGATPTVEARVNERGPWTTLTLESGSSSVAKAVGSDFPLVPGDFPLLPGDFALTAIDPPIVVARYRLDSGVLERGRTIQLRIKEATAGVRFERVGWRIVAMPRPVERARS